MHADNTIPILKFKCMNKCQRIKYFNLLFDVVVKLKLFKDTCLLAIFCQTSIVYLETDADELLISTTNEEMRFEVS